MLPWVLPSIQIDFILGASDACCLGCKLLWVQVARTTFDGIYFFCPGCNFPQLPTESNTALEVNFALIAPKATCFQSHIVPMATCFQKACCPGCYLRCNCLCLEWNLPQLPMDANLPLFSWVKIDTNCLGCKVFGCKLQKLPPMQFVFVVLGAIFLSCLYCLE